MLALSVILFAPAAEAETRTLKLYYTHTRESAEITFKRNGRYIQSGLNELNRFLRDWRRNEPTKMDPRLFDLIWETYRAVGAREPIHVVSAYRSPETNSMLRKRSSGVAEKSQHMLGKAMDFYIPGVKLSKLRAAALTVQGGGVGYYPRSGSPFVHLDVGNVRHWPRMSRSELLALFPDGKTMHVPSDGKPLPGYKQALAAYNQRKRGGGSIQMASAPSGGNFLANLFGGGADEEEDSGEIAVAAAPELARGSLPARAQRSAPRPAATVTAAEPAAQAAPEPEPQAETAEAIIAALPERNIPTPAFAPRPEVGVGAAAPSGALEAFDTASAATTPAAEEVQVALDIPVPTPRPDYAPPAEMLLASAGEASSGEQATTDPASGSAAIAQILAEKRDETAPISVASVAPVPGPRPDLGQQVTAFAAVADAEPVAAAAQKVALAVEGSAALKGARVAAVAPPTPRLAMLKRPDGVDPAAVMSTGVRTTEKGARLTASDYRPEAEPVVVPVQEEIAGWALQNSHVTRLRSATDRAKAHEAIRAAPSAVYTAGFAQDGETVAANRFTGSAVTFLSVAKFDAN